MVEFVFGGVSVALFLYSFSPSPDLCKAIFRLHFCVTMSKDAETMSKEQEEVVISKDEEDVTVSKVPPPALTSMLSDTSAPIQSPSSRGTHIFTCNLVGQFCSEYVQHDFHSWMMTSLVTSDFLCI